MLQATWATVLLVNCSNKKKKKYDKKKSLLNIIYALVVEKFLTVYACLFLSFYIYVY